MFSLTQPFCYLNCIYKIAFFHYEFLTSYMRYCKNKWQSQLNKNLFWNCFGRNKHHIIPGVFLRWVSPNTMTTDTQKWRKKPSQGKNMFSFISNTDIEWNCWMRLAKERWSETRSMEEQWNSRPVTKLILPLTSN